MKLAFDKNMCLTITTATLVVAVAILAVAVFQMNARFESLTAEAATLEPLDMPKAATAPDPDWKLLDDPFDRSPVAEWDPFQEMERMRLHIDQVFGNAFGRFEQSPAFRGMLNDFSFRPQFDLLDEESRYRVRVDLPGSEESEIDVNLESQTLSVKATSKQLESTSDDQGQILHQERRIGSFHRQIALPKPVDAGSLKTHYEDGVLTITVDKAK